MSLLTSKGETEMEMRRHIIALGLSLLMALHAAAQEKRVMNRPYTDLRPFHFGVVVGTHLQDIEFENIGTQLITNEDGTTAEKLITCDQDRWDGGFTVGVLGEARLGTYFAARLAPTLYFGNRHLTFHNFSDTMEDGQPLIRRQDMKSIYIATDINLIYSAQRFNNHRPYMLVGLNPMVNLSGKDEDIVRLKKFDCMLELGVGCDFYLPFFKLRPELKFGYGLMNTLDTDHTKLMKDRNQIVYSNSVRNARSKMVCLTFYFE